MSAKASRKRGFVLFGPSLGSSLLRDLFSLLGRHASRARLPTHAPQRHGGSVLAVIRHLVLDLAGGDPGDHDGALVGIGRAALAFWTFCHVYVLMLSGKLGKAEQNKSFSISLQCRAI
jgi:hypothetical protein